MTAIDPRFIDHLVASVAEAVPGETEDPAARRRLVRTMLLAMRPADAAQAMAAARAVAAHYAAMDAFRRAAQPDQSDAMATKLRANAAAMMRLTRSIAAELQAQRAEAEAETAPPPPAPAPQPAPEARRPTAASGPKRADDVSAEDRRSAFNPAPVPAHVPPPGGEGHGPGHAALAGRILVMR